MRLLTLLIAAGVGSAQGNPLLKKALTLVSEHEKLAAKLGRAPTAEDVAKAEAESKKKFFKRLLGVVAAASGLLLFK